MLKKLLSAALVVTVFSSIVPVQYAKAAENFEIYVDQNAAAGGSGSKSTPFSTLEEARTEASRHKDESVTIILRGGDYYVDSSIVFDQSDSRSEENPLTITSYEGERASLVGGKRLDTSKLQPVTDTEILNRIPVEAREQIMSLSLKDSGIEYWKFKQFGTYYTSTVSEMPDLYVNDEKMTIARWPNEGYAKVGEVIDPGTPDNPLGKKAANAHGAVFKYNDDRIAKWKTAADAMLYGYWQWNWSCCNLRLKSIDTVNKTISTVDSATFAVTQGQRFMAYNLLEELDAPGEWYIDRDNEILYYYPVCDIEATDMIISQLSDSIIKVEGCENVCFKQIDVEYGKHDLITVDSTSKNIEFLGCNIRGSSGYGAVIKGINCGIKSSNIYDCGEEGVLIQGGICNNDEYTLSKNYVINCDIYNCGQRLTTAAGIRSQAHGAIITNNKIHDIPAWGIGWGGFETVVEYNEIYNVLTETEDAGAIYAGRTSQARGSSVSHNYIHDIYGQDDYRSGMYVGIYFDDYLCAIKSEGNVLENVSIPFYGHHGAQCIVQNNIIVNKTALSDGWVVWTRGGGAASSFVTSHTSIDWTKEPYATLFPEAQKMTIDNIYDCFDTVVKNNLIVNHEGANILKVVSDQGDVSNNYECDHDPGFVDMENHNYALKPDSEVFSIIPEFKNADMSKMGLYEDEYRPKETATVEKDPFTLAFPKENEGNVSTRNVECAWNVCPKLHVEKYRLIISKDKDFTDIVYNYQTPEFSAVVDELDQNTKYYWRVDAVAENNGEVKYYTNAGGARSFTTSYYKEIYDNNSLNVKDLSDFFKDSENWKKGSCNDISVNSNEVAFTGTGVGGYEGEYLDYDTLYHFGAVFDGGSWYGFAVHAANTDQFGWVHNSHYLVIVKPTAIEIHKYPNHFKDSQMIKSVPAEISLEDKAVHDIAFGTHVIDGTNYIVFAIDGKVIFNIEDTYKGEVKAPGYFAIYTIDGKLTLTKPIGEIPNISFKKRELPAQYEEALDSTVLMKAGEARAYVDESEVQINTVNPDITPIVKNNITLIPLRFVSESLGAEVEWNAEERSVSVTKGDTLIKMKIGSNEFTVNGEAVTQDSAPIIENDTTYLPARFIAETLGFDVKYDENTKLILIYPPENEELLSDEADWWNLLNNYVMYAKAEKEVFSNPAWDNGGKLIQ